MGMPVVLGWVIGDLSAGFMATIGAFTSLYATDRPYANRAVLLAGIALCLVLVVGLGLGTQLQPMMAVPVVVVIAVVATFVCNSLRIGPPGAYMFALACATGTAIPAAHLAFWQIASLVLSGGAFSWVVQMAGALVRPRGPEGSAVSAASNAVARFAEAAGLAAQDNARHGAALALHDAWAVLVTFQPARTRPDGALTRLRAMNRELHLLFVARVNAGDQPTGFATMAGRAREIGAAARALGAARRVERAPPAGMARVPLGHPGIWASLRENVRRGSPAVTAATRVGIAVGIAGIIGAGFGLERAYWAMAAAVLVLHQGLDWTRTLQRGVERMGGTLVGLCLAGAILAVHPGGIWLVATVAGLQFFIEMTVTRNYALSVIFVTAMALTIASGGHGVADAGSLLWARGGDTVIGCLVGLVVHAITVSRGAAVPIRQQVMRTLQDIDAALGFLATGGVRNDAALRARRDLQRSIIFLVTTCELQMGGLPRHRGAAERLWPAVAAVQRLGYKVLAACWLLEEAGEDRAGDMVPTLLSAPALAEIRAALARIIAAEPGGLGMVNLSHEPDFLQPEIRHLINSLVASD